MFALHRRRRIIIAVSVVAGVFLLLVTMGIFGLLRGPGAAGGTGHAGHEASATPSSAAPVVQPRPIVATSDPERFVRALARALFTWDTRHPGGVSEWAQTLVDAADADEASAVASDVRNYLPGPEYWGRLGDYGTRQWIEMESVVVPSTWWTAIAQAAPGQAPADAAAFTIVGVRQRAGTWGEQEMRTSRRISFTVFIACPADDPCVLLRLSRPDSPLE
ncbi:hypothetical protein [Agromyces sp. NPDC049794]|uniref:hypothetical protein n=1 Tax=unclassified Agromyces TaxID=2639701 RepID=UPI0033FBD825